MLFSHLTKKMKLFRLSKIRKILLFIIFAVNISIAGYLLKIRQDVSISQAQWESSSRVEAAILSEISLLRSSLGYGGFIHNFKNYIIRRRAKYLVQARNSIDDALASLDRMRSFYLPDEDMRALDTIEKVIKLYAEKMAVAERAVSRGFSITEIDLRVRVYDTKALEAFALLARQAEMRLLQEQDEFRLNMQSLSNLTSIGAGILMVFLVTFALLAWKLINALQVASDKRDAALKTARHESAARLRFIATLSHEIRTPLSGLMGLINLLKGKEEDKEKLQFLNFAENAGTALNRIVNDVLDLSKLDTNSVKFETDKVDIRSIVSGVIGLSRFQDQRESVQLASSIAESVPNFFEGDTTRVRQVISNLITNAFRYSESDSIDVIVSTNQQADKTILRVEVKDYGVGISELNQKILFKDFSQINGSLRNAAEGVGLGLAISKRIIEGLGGQIGVISALGEGACFWFEIPIKEIIEFSDPIASEKPAEPPSSSEVGPYTPRVLVAEDNVIIQTVMNAYLSRLNLNFEIVENGKVAIERFAPGKFDLIILDMSMPEMDGLEVLNHLFASWKSTEVPPIFVLTAHTTDENKMDALKAGAKKVLYKPISFSELRTEIEAVIPLTKPVDLRTAEA